MTTTEEKPIPTIGKYSPKPYKCKECGMVSEHGTNHWGDIYPYCSNCRAVTVHECQEAVPEGYGVPPKWGIVNIGEVSTVCAPGKMRPRPRQK